MATLKIKNKSSWFFKPAHTSNLKQNNRIYSIVKLMQVDVNLQNFKFRKIT